MKILSNKASYNINGVIEGKREGNITFICFWTVLGLFFGLQGGFFPNEGVEIFFDYFPQQPVTNTLLRPAW